MFNRVSTKVLVTAVLSLSAILGLTACGSSGSANNTAETTVAAASYEIVSDAVVASGLGEVAVLAARAQTESATSVDTAKETIVEMYDKWYEFEGTIRANDQPIYLELEDGLAKFKIGIQNTEPEKAVAGLMLFSTKSAEYLTSHPA